MNINPLIEQAFENFEVDGEKIPIFFVYYEGKAEKYLTYYCWMEQPENYFDDDNHAEICYATIDVWSTKNYKNIVEAVKKNLKENGFYWTDNGAEMFENDTGYYHVPINFYIAESLAKRE